MGFLQGFISGVLDEAVRDVTGRRALERPRGQAFSDWARQGEEFSVECALADAVANLCCSGFQLNVDGESERARLLDSVADRYVRDGLVGTMALGLVTGDALVVPVWDGTAFHNHVVAAPDFRIAVSAAGRPLAVAYVAEERSDGLVTWSLVQVVRLVDYDAVDGTRARGCAYSLLVAKDGRLHSRSLAGFPEWAERYEAEWVVPDVDRLLVARFRCPQRDPKRPNSTYGTPLCYGASTHLREVHYLTQAMHDEFELSEKAVMADRALFAKDQQGNLVLPRGRDRLFMATRGGSVDSSSISQWAPTIQSTPYAEALELAYRGVERDCGIDAGILSKPNDGSYQNVDNVRKSTRNTQALVNRCRGVADNMLDDLLYSWDMLANHYGLPQGEWSHAHRWSDDYINTFADQRDALLSGYGIGATDAADYRAFVTGEDPEVARERVALIASGRALGIVGEE